MQFQAFLAFAAGLTCSTATAGGLPFDLTSDGRLTLGYSDRTTGADAFLIGNANLRLSFGRFGAELGVFGRADALDTPHETYGTLTYDFANGGRMSAGVPRPAYDEFAVSALERHFPSLGIDRTGATRSEATNGAMFANYLPFGVLFENGTDRLRYAASVHHATAPGVTIAGFGAATELHGWTVEGAVEARFGATSEVSAKARVHRQAGIVSGGIGYFAPGAVAGPDLLELFGSIEPTTKITLSGVVQIALDGSADPTGAVAARYAMSDSLAMSVGVASDAGSDAVASAFLDWYF